MIVNGIELMINFYYFDMLEVLQKQYGGFELVYVVELFVCFVCIVFSLFGYKVKYWIIFNELIVLVEGGYLYDFYYLCKKDGWLVVQVVFNIMLVYVKVVMVYCELVLVGEIGVVFNLILSYIFIDSDVDKKVVGYVDLFFNCSFFDLLVKYEFFKVLCEIFVVYDCLLMISKDDVVLIFSVDIDFFGVNYYVLWWVKVCESEYDFDYFILEYYFENVVNLQGCFNFYCDNNEILLQVIYDIVVNICDNYGNIKWYFVEIGIVMD